MESAPKCGCDYEYYMHLSFILYYLYLLVAMLRDTV